MLTIRNQTDYPDDEVKELIRLAMKPFDVKRTLVIVGYAKRFYSGLAVDGLLWNMRPWPKSARYGIWVRVGRPEQFPMTEAYWRHGWAGNHRGEWPLFKHQTWQEALVTVAAHEAKHVEDFREEKRRRGSWNRRHRELACELAAQKVLTEYLREPRTAINRKEIAVSDQNNTGELAAALRTAVEAIPGVAVLDKGAYSIVKHDKTTLGYLKGKTRLVRVDFPVREGTRGSMEIKTAEEIPSAIDHMSSFIPPLEREAKSDPKPTRKKSA